MIAYDELAAALQRWRVQNGLPIVTPVFAATPRTGAAPAYAAPAPAYAAPAPAYAAPAPAYAAPAPAYAAPAPRTAPPTAPPSGRSTLFGVAPPPVAAYTPIETLDEGAEDLIDAEVVDDSQDVYDNEGSDFAVAFGGSAPRHGVTTLADEDDEREATQMGATPPPSDRPSWPEPKPWSPDSGPTTGRDPDDDLP